MYFIADTCFWPFQDKTLMSCIAVHYLGHTGNSCCLLEIGGETLIWWKTISYAQKACAALGLFCGLEYVPAPRLLHGRGLLGVTAGGMGQSCPRAALVALNGLWVGGNRLLPQQDVLENICCLRCVKQLVWWAVAVCLFVVLSPDAPGD